MEKFDLRSFRLLVCKTVLAGINALRYIEICFFGGELCLCCGGRSGIIPLCKSCVEKLNSTRNVRRCKICGKQLVSEIEVCSACRCEPVLKNVDQAIPLFSYRLWRKNLLFAWKTEEKRVLSPFFAGLVFDQYRILFGDDFSVPVIPVPPRPGKIRKKGWDQVDELCFYLRNIYGIKTLKMLKRLTSYQQKKLNRQKRLEQIQKAYVLKNYSQIRHFMDHPPEEVVLVDDVMTTGSTIEACAEELKKAGVGKVTVITLFVVD